MTAARQATAAIPIVFPAAVDPLGSGLIGVTRSPGRYHHRPLDPGNRSAGKRLEFLREVVPTVRRLAVMANTCYPAAV